MLRFGHEHFRGDHSDYSPLLGNPLTVSQWVAVATFAIALIGLVVRHRAPLRLEPTAGAPVAATRAAPAG